MVQVSQHGQNSNTAPYVLDGVSYETWGEYIKARYDAFTAIHGNQFKGFGQRFVQDIFISPNKVSQKLTPLKKDSVLNQMDSFEGKGSYLELSLKNGRYSKNKFNFDGHKISYEADENQDRPLDKKSAEQMVKLAMEAGINPMKFSSDFDKDIELLKAAEKKLKTPSRSALEKTKASLAAAPKKIVNFVKTPNIISGRRIVSYALLGTMLGVGLKYADHVEDRRLERAQEKKFETAEEKENQRLLFSRLSGIEVSDTKKESLFTKGAPASPENDRVEEVAVKETKKSSTKKTVQKKVSQSVVAASKVVQKVKKPSLPEVKKTELKKQNKNLQNLLAKKAFLEKNLQSFQQIEDELKFYEDLYRASNIARRLKLNGGATFPFLDLKRISKNPKLILNAPIHVTRQEARGQIFDLFDLVKQIPDKEANAAGISKKHFQRLDDAVWENGRYGVVPSLKRIEEFNEKHIKQNEDNAEARHKGRNVNGFNGKRYMTFIRSEEIALQRYISDLIVGGSPEGKLFRKSHLNDFYRTFDLAAEKTWDLRKITRSKKHREEKIKIKNELNQVNREIKIEQKSLQSKHKYGETDNTSETKTKLFSENLKTSVADNTIHDEYQDSKNIVTGYEGVGADKTFYLGKIYKAGKPKTS